MKRLLAAVSLTVGLAGALLTAPAALADPHDRDRGRNERSWNDRRNDDRHGNRRDDRHDGQRHGQRRDHDRDWNHRHHDRHSDNHHDRHPDRHYGRYDRRDHDRRYYYQPRYRVVHYHPPRGYRPHVWYRGARLPSAYYAPRYVVYNYGDYRLRPPPRGYHWVRVDNDVVLAAITTGIVLQVVNGIFY